MRRRALTVLALLCLAAAAPPGPAEPSWIAEVAGTYAGRILSGGRMECHRTVFSVLQGHLAGHYAIDGADPYQGDLTDFVPKGDSSGTFTWTDRYGEGQMFVVFARDRASLTGAWGMEEPSLANPVWAVRGGVAGCSAAVS